MATVSFDVLLRGPAPSSEARLDTLELLRPSPEAVRRVQTWLEENEVSCYSAEFSIVCNCETSQFEHIFSVKVTADGIAGEPKVPAPIANDVEQVTLSRAPELY